MDCEWNGGVLNDDGLHSAHVYFPTKILSDLRLDGMNYPSNLNYTQRWSLNPFRKIISYLNSTQQSTLLFYTLFY
jgi:hypothetical protein